VTRERKLVLTLVLFGVALVILAFTGTTHSPVPLFFIWIPLLTVPYVLTRPEPGFTAVPPADPGAMKPAPTDEPDAEPAPPEPAAPDPA
jgi:hypothetical protein